MYQQPIILVRRSRCSCTSRSTVCQQSAVGCSFFVAASIFWNTLPDDVQSAPSVSSFRRQLDILVTPVISWHFSIDFLCYVLVDFSNGLGSFTHAKNVRLRSTLTSCLSVSATSYLFHCASTLSWPLLWSTPSWVHHDVITSSVIHSLSFTLPRVRIPQDMLSMHHNMFSPGLPSRTKLEPQTTHRISLLVFFA